MILDANAFPFQAFGADGHAARKPQIDGTGVVVAVGEIHIRQPLFVFGKPGNDHVQLAPAHFFVQERRMALHNASAISGSNPACVPSAGKEKGA